MNKWRIVFVKEQEELVGVALQVKLSDEESWNLVCESEIKKVTEDEIATVPVAMLWKIEQLREFGCKQSRLVRRTKDELYKGV